MSDTEALLVLNAVKGLGNAGIRKLLKRYGSALKILSLGERDLSVNPVIPAKVIQNILHFPKDKFLKTEYNLMERRQVQVVTYLDDYYPKSLREITDAPVVLYAKGEVSFDNPFSIAIVGSRKASLYGLSITEKFSMRLAALGFTVVSGLARGIDAAAHKGTLKAKGKTIAVLGCGLNHIYPLENVELMGQISESGVILSEFPMQTAPFAFNFPRRNRIISGLSLGVIVVEAAQRSGALITADFALEQGREVYAVPGKIDQAYAQGVNNLIKQGAKLVTSVEDILEDMKTNISASLNEDQEDKTHVSQQEFSMNRLENLSKDEKHIIEHITDRPVHIDDLINSCGESVPIMSILLQLEIKKLVKQLPGKLFVR